MENAIKKVTIELENGEVLEYGNQLIIFVEEQTTENERKLAGEHHVKATGMINANPAFVASVTETLIGVLRSNSPRLECAVLMKHTGADKDFTEMLAQIFGK